MHAIVMLSAFSGFMFYIFSGFSYRCMSSVKFVFLDLHINSKCKEKEKVSIL